MSRARKLFYLCKTGGRRTAARLARWRATAQQVIARSEQLTDLSDEELLRASRGLQWRARTGDPLDGLLVEAYALVREAAHRVHGMKHYPVQIMGATALFEGNVAEMQTGEGKTLTATMPAFLRALPGHGCHVITVNDYLAGRDAEIMGPIYAKLGLTTGVVIAEMETDDRREAYAKDITYGTAKELGFDFLRDRLRTGAAIDDGMEQSAHRKRASGSEAPVQRGHYFALIDEADSVLIDEARTPLIIGLMLPNQAPTVGLYRWCQRAVHQLQRDQDFVYEPQRRTAWLTDAGCRHVMLLPKPSLMDTIDLEKIYTHVEQAITARFGFERDRDYVIKNQEIFIVDESTGRMMEGRKWQDGLHQAVEAKEFVPITAATGQAARITIQSFFREYTHLAGMTGTAVLARRELKKIYHLNVTKIPTNLPCIRTSRRVRIFATMAAKRQAVIAAIREILEAGRAVLVGTPSVEASEALSNLLKESKIRHRVLNARYLAEEAEIVGEAGEPGRVTIATNMAGRGTDIHLTDAVRKSGGLHVIATEMHTSPRIDRQLVGRAARQGDPGSFQIFLSLEDELLRVLKPKVRKRLLAGARPNQKGEVGGRRQGLFKRTQAKLERMYRKQRKELLKQEKQRLGLYDRMGLDPYLELTE